MIMNIVSYMKCRRRLKNIKTRQRERDKLAADFKAKQALMSYQLEELIARGDYAEAQRVLNEHKQYVAQVKELAKVI